FATSRSSFFKASATVAESGTGTGSPFFSCTLISLISVSPAARKDGCGDHDKTLVPRPKTITYDLRLTNICYFSRSDSIGAPSPRAPPGAGRQSKSKESSSCSIHDEGLPELPTKSWNLPNVTDVHSSKALVNRASSGLSSLRLSAYLCDLCAEELFNAEFAEIRRGPQSENHAIANRLPNRPRAPAIVLRRGTGQFCSETGN